MADIPDRKKLIEYLPPFMQSFKEIQEICRVENARVNEIDKDIARLLDEAFISDCDGYGIRKYENMLGILPEAADSLEDRKARVLVRWNDFIPYTFRALVQRLNTYCGVNNYDLECDFENYELMISTHLTHPTAVRELEKTIDRMVPLNMHYETLNDIYHEINAVVYGAGAAIAGIQSTITTEINATEAIQTKMRQSGAVITHKTVTINSESEV